jgi:hypothetical protein
MEDLLKSLTTSFAIPVATSIITTLTTLFVKRRMEQRKWRREDYLSANNAVSSACSEVTLWETMPHSLHQKGVALKAVAAAIVKAPPETSKLLDNLLVELRKEKPDIRAVGFFRGAIAQTLRAENDASKQNQKPRRKNPSKKK